MIKCKEEILFYENAKFKENNNISDCITSPWLWYNISRRSYIINFYPIVREDPLTRQGDESES